MKRYILLLILSLLMVISRGQDPAYPPAPAAPQNIVAAEYFIDNDPGVGKAIALTITPGINITIPANNIQTTGLVNGVHYIGIRTRNAEGKWSITEMKSFIVDFDPAYPIVAVTPQNIVAAEYFIDTDPGAGNGIPLSISASVNLVDAIAAINTTGLVNGVHRFYIRTRSNEGHWSITNFSEFILDTDPPYPSTPPAPQNIIAAEYFIDADPGFGNGQSITITPAVDLMNLVASVNTAGLTNGIHRLFIRTKSNEGRWSLTNISEFNVDSDPAYPSTPPAPQNIIAAEYFIDADPGQGLGTSIALTPGTDISNLSFNVNTTGLSNGAHRLYVRAKSMEGKWSVTNHSEFFTDLLNVKSDTLLFGNIPLSITATRDLIIENKSGTDQSISSIYLGSGFSHNAVLPMTISGGKSDTIQVSFTPVNQVAYLDSIVFTTTSGKYKTVLSGTGIAQTFSWILSPTNGYNYGNVQVSGNKSYTFTIQNKSNVPVILSNVVIDNPAFVATFTAGTSIGVNGSLSLPVNFTPTATGAQQAQIKILSSTPGVDSATVVVYGNGYLPGTPPTLEYVSGAPYNGSIGVSPGSGPTGAFTYKILYKSSSNKPPMAGYPKVSIDLNGNQAFNDLNEGEFAMVKEGAGTDYITGVIYTYTFLHNNLTNNAGYKFDAIDADGNAASSGVAYKTGPVVTNDVLDLRIFANDISFSDNNPNPGSTFTVTARISNSSAVPAVNVPIKFYQDTILLGSAVLPSVAGNSSSTINYTLNFADEGFYPIKVWIDSSQTLGENSVLNNYAIRPVIVGTPSLPGGINATTNAIRQECPILKVLISGHASYFGTGSNTNVAGAEVTINTGSQIFKTTTDANGNYSTVVTGVTCGSGNFAYAVTVTDFTFTSTPASHSIPMPCPSPYACTPPVPPVNMGGVVMGNAAPCSQVAGTITNFEFKIKIRERNITRMFSSFDEVLGGQLQVYVNGELYETRNYGNGSLFPGQEVIVIMPYQLPKGTAPVTVRAVFAYTYSEIGDLLTPHYITYNIDESKTYIPQPSLPDLTINSFAQSGYTAFRFNAANLECVSAGSHEVKIYDGSTLIKTQSISSIAGKSFVTVNVSDPSFTPGVHSIRIVIDEANTISETNESNNDFTFQITVPAPELSIIDVKASPSQMSIGSNTQFAATLKNTGKTTGSFNVLFSMNGVQIGSKKNVTSLPENSTLTVTSDTYTVTSNPNACGDILEVFVDSDNSVSESNEGNNKKTIPLTSDLAPYQLPGEVGSASNPARVRVNNTGNFFPAIRNIGIRDAANVQVHYLLDGAEISTENIASVKAGIPYAAHGVFSYMFNTPGTYVIRVVADSSNQVCEADENNNAGNYYILVTDSKPDLEVLSQYVSPSSLNPLPLQNITIVGTVRNAGGKVSPSSVMRFFVDDVQLGDDVPFNAIQPGKDTTVSATVTYASMADGVRIMKITVDPFNTVDEERENNNTATRALVVGEAPDLTKQFANAIRFNPNGFSAGDSVTISYAVKNNGTVGGSAWVRFLIYDLNGGLRSIDSIAFNLVAGGTTTVSRKMYFDIISGKVVAQIVNCIPTEYNTVNNSDTLHFSTILPLKRNVIFNGNLDMKYGMPEEVPGWIGGKLLLGDFDLTVNGSILNADTSHFIVTNGKGKLKLVNNNTENIFPVAADTSHGNFIKLNNAGVSDLFSARVAPYVLRNGNSGDTVFIGNVNRTWFIDEQTPGGSNATITLMWNVTDEQPTFDRSRSIFAHYTNNWILSDSVAALKDAENRYYISQSGISSFSPFTVTNSQSVVPISLLHFEAIVQDKDVRLQWQTSNERDVKQFVIEHSQDGNQFQPAGNVVATNLPGINHYQFMDYNVAAGVHYYRLKIADIDGGFSYSPIRMVKLTEAYNIQAFPNPARDYITVKGLNTGGLLELINMEGKLIFRTKTTKSAMTINLGNIANGMYILQYRNKGDVKQIKIIVE